MIHHEVTARKIINRKGIENAIRLNSAIGGSTNAILHMLAIAYEADVNLTVERLRGTDPHDPLYRQNESRPPLPMSRISTAREGCPRS